MSGRWVSAGLSAVVVVAISLGFGPMAAAAEETPGVLVVKPANGDLETPIDVSTAGFCERGTTFMVAVSGKGINGDGDEIIVGATDLRWLEPTGYPSYDVALSLTLDDYFDRADVNKPRGEYTLTFICRNRLDVEPLRVFTAVVDIDKKGRYEALGLASQELPEVLENLGLGSVPIPGSNQVDPVEPSTPDSTGTITSDDASPPGQDPAISDTGGQADGSGMTAPPSAMPEVMQTTATADNSTSVQNTLLIVGALLLVGSMLAWIWMSRRESSKAATSRGTPAEDSTP
jgi:hypothetical protein